MSHAHITGPGLDEAPTDLAEDLAVAVLLLPVPEPVQLGAYPFLGAGHQWRLGPHCIYDQNIPGEEGQRYLRDAWRRLTVFELAQERGLGKDVVELACGMLRFESVIHREGWQAWDAARRRARASGPPR